MELFSIWKTIKADGIYIVLILFLMLMILVTAIVVKNECKCDGGYLNEGKDFGYNPKESGTEIGYINAEDFDWTEFKRQNNRSASDRS